MIEDDGYVWHEVTDIAELAAGRRTFMRGVKIEPLTDEVERLKERMAMLEGDRARLHRQVGELSTRLRISERSEGTLRTGIASVLESITVPISAAVALRELLERP